MVRYAVSRLADETERTDRSGGGNAGADRLRSDDSATAEFHTDEFHHDDWIALAGRFAGPDGVDYGNLQRVVRLLEAYMDRLSHARPEQVADPPAQLAFYINAFNAITVYSVLQHYPIASLDDIPGAWTRPWPIGRELLSLYRLLHEKIRVHGDPRIHAAVVPATRSAPQLRGYKPTTLATDLDLAMKEYLQRTAHSDGSMLVLPAIFRSYAGDFIVPTQMPSLLQRVQGYVRPDRLSPHIQRYLNAEAAAILADPAASLRFASDDRVLNDRLRRSHA